MGRKQCGNLLPERVAWVVTAAQGHHQESGRNLEHRRPQQCATSIHRLSQSRRDASASLEQRPIRELQLAIPQQAGEGSENGVRPRRVQIVNNNRHTTLGGNLCT
eukprot:COSAG02_NODE_22071_length_764_cov_1.055639_1_plen_105_part_00